MSEILRGYALPVRGDHGAVHWARVLENGLRVADAIGADREVVALFALFHDFRRVNECRDDGHGERGGEFARSLRGEFDPSGRGSIRTPVRGMPVTHGRVHHRRSDSARLLGRGSV